MTFEVVCFPKNSGGHGHVEEYTWPCGGVYKD